MSEVKITDYTEEGDPQPDDLAELVDLDGGPGGIPLSVKAKIRNILKALRFGDLTAKATPIAADEVAIADSAAAGVPKRSTLTQLDTALRGITGVESGATADQSGAEIKAAYEGEANTNAFTDADATKLDGIETGADVTDAINVAAAGAVMEADFDANTILSADADDTPAPLTIAEDRIVGRLTGGNIVDLTGAQVRGITDGQVDTVPETANFAFTAAHAGKLTTIANVAAVTATIPTNATVAFPLNTILMLQQTGAGKATWTAAGGVTINVNVNYVDPARTNGLFAYSFARKTATNTWIVGGDIEALFPEQSWEFALSDETTDLTTGVKVTWYTPFAINLTDIKADVNTAPTGSSIIMDVHDNGVTVMDTDKLEIEVNEFSTRNATTSPTISDGSLAANVPVTLEIDQIGSTIAGKGAKLSLIGRRAN